MIPANRFKTCATPAAAPCRNRPRIARPRRISDSKHDGQFTGPMHDVDREGLLFADSFVQAASPTDVDGIVATSCSTRKPEAVLVARRVIEAAFRSDMRASGVFLGARASVWSFGSLIRRFTVARPGVAMSRAS